ncbi:MAG: uracil-DNA glycosylase [Dehalococcoidia bacterium]
MADLIALHEAVRQCIDCGLSQGRTLAVPGEGSPTADLMFIGEGPGFNEDRQGRPFVGAAGQFLNELLASIGLRREDVFITNMVKCRPPNNRDPFPGEIEACSKYLDAQIEAIRPRVIVPLGRHALARWFPNESIGKLRARPKQFGDITLFPLYHPAAALHNGGLRSTIEEDFAKLGELLRQAREQPAAPAQPAAPLPAPAPTAQSDDQPEPQASDSQDGASQQLSMF